MKRMLIYLRFVFLCTIIVSSVVSCTKKDESSSPLPTKVVFNPTSLNMVIGDSKAIIATIEPAFTDPIKSVITWSSTDSKIARVVNGTVFAISAGEVTVKAKTVNGIECLCHVRVNSKPILAIGLNIENQNAMIQVGKTFKLDYEIIPFDANRNREIFWQSEDETVATVKDGIVTAVSKGSVTIKGSFINGVSAKTKLVVKPLPYVISPEMIGTWKCVKLQARYLKTGDIFEESEMDQLFRFPAGMTKETWCIAIKNEFKVKSTKGNKVEWPIALRGGDVLKVVGDITRNDDLDNQFLINYHSENIGINLGTRAAEYNTVRVTWLPKEKKLLYDEPNGSFYDFIYTCEIVKEPKIAPVVSRISFEKLRSVKSAK
ncbi:MAG: Ig-like domain-containing protein [Marinifilaceae bacterium]